MFHETWRIFSQQQILNWKFRIVIEPIQNPSGFNIILIWILNSKFSEWGWNTSQTKNVVENFGMWFSYPKYAEQSPYFANTLLYLCSTLLGHLSNPWSQIQNIPYFSPFSLSTQEKLGVKIWKTPNLGPNTSLAIAWIGKLFGGAHSWLTQPMCKEDFVGPTLLLCCSCSLTTWQQLVIQTSVFFI